MAKKSRKPNLPQETLERARRELERSGDLPEQPAPPPDTASAVSATAPAAKPAPKPAQRPARQVDLAQEYSYVIEDLEQMAMLAAGIMIGLVILSFFI
jgi:hypothetical protein